MFDRVINLYLRLMSNFTWTNLFGLMIAIYAVYSLYNQYLSWYPNWTYISDNSPGLTLPSLLLELGPPDTINTSAGGYAIWTKGTLHSRGKCWNRVELWDEQVTHNDHNDFLYTEYHLRVPSELVPNILSLSDTIMYDKLKEVLIVRSNKLNKNTAITLLAMYVSTTRMSLRQARVQLPQYISQSNDINKLHQFNKELCDYLKNEL